MGGTSNQAVACLQQCCGAAARGKVGMGLQSPATTSPPRRVMTGDEEANWNEA